MIKLFLVQHGEAVSKDIDPARPLSPQGGQDVKNIAEFLNKSDIIVDKIFHSGKMRAHQSAEILGEQLLLKGDVDAITGINPNDSIESFSLKAHKLKHDTMVVGHLPFMVKLVSYLITGKEDQVVVAYKPGSIVCLEQDVEQKWQIQWMIRPELIK